MGKVCCLYGDGDGNDSSIFSFFLVLNNGFVMNGDCDVKCGWSFECGKFLYFYFIFVNDNLMLIWFV